MPGQLVEFRLTMNDGSIVKVQPFGMYMLINDKWYKASPGSCLELYTLGNRLIDYGDNG